VKSLVGLLKEGSNFETSTKFT